MVFRRPFGPRRRRPAAPGAQAPPVVRRALRRAQVLREAGDYRGAAAIYDRLADEAYQRDRIRPGVQMTLEAGRAYLLAKDYAKVQERALRALRALLGLGRPGPAMSLVDRVCEALEAQGAAEEAKRFRATVDALLRERGFVPDDVRRALVTTAPPRGSLPAQCPSCYAPLRPDEVEWLGPDRAQCTYCGSVVLTQ